MFLGTTKVEDFDRWWGSFQLQGSPPPSARVRLRAGRRLDSPALVADGNHPRIDGFVSLGVVVSAAVVSLGLNIADPLIGLIITLVILKITWDSRHTIRSSTHTHDQ